MKKILLLLCIFVSIAFADKVKTIKDIRINHTMIAKDTYIEVSPEMAIYLCNEGENKGKRVKKAIRTPVEEQSEPHADHTNL